MEQRPAPLSGKQSAISHRQHQATLHGLIDHLRLAEVSAGLETAFDCYEHGAEPAMYEARQPPSAGFL